MWEVPEAHKRNRIAPDRRGVADPESLGRILIVDDDPCFLRVLARILSGEKFDVTSATGACDALDLVKSAQFDLIICDLRMPECDGVSFLQALRRGGNKVPVIILTAYAEVDTYLDAMNAGAADYLNKPIRSADLLKVVRSCLQSRRVSHDSISFNAA